MCIKNNVLNLNAYATLHSMLHTLISPSELNSELKPHGHSKSEIVNLKASFFYYATFPIVFLHF